MATATVETRRITDLAGVAEHLGITRGLAEYYLRRPADPLPSLADRGPGRGRPRLFDLDEVDEWAATKRHQAYPQAPRPFRLEDLEQLLPRASSGDVAELLGIQDRQLYRLRRSGLTETEADELAIRAGLHPAIVWPGWLTG